MTAKDEGDRRPNGYSYAVTVCRNDLPSPEEIGAQAARRTLDLLGAKKIKTETLPVIIENQNVGRMLQWSSWPPCSAAASSRSAPSWPTKRASRSPADISP